MSTLPDERHGEVADVLAAHQRTLDGAGSCRCGEWPPASHDVPWPDHVADALAPMLAGWLAEAWDEGKDALAVALTRPLSESGMRTYPPNPYRARNYRQEKADE